MADGSLNITQAEEVISAAAQKGIKCAVLKKKMIMSGNKLINVLKQVQIVTPLKSCAHVGCVQPAVMWVHCLHAAQISERACYVCARLWKNSFFLQKKTKQTKIINCERFSEYSGVSLEWSRSVSGPWPAPRREQKADLHRLMSGTVAHLVVLRENEKMLYLS